jgi:class 3 adenylate cyclase
MARRLAAIMYTDAADYSATARADESAALQLLHDLEEALRPTLRAFHGHRVKSIGEDRLVEFRSAVDAVDGAVDLQRRVHELEVPEGQVPLRVRVGIHVGDAERRGIGILGGAVETASRIGPLAEPGGIWLTEPVYVQVRSKVPYQLERLGPKDLKGLREPIAVYHVILPWIGATGTPEIRPPPSLPAPSAPLPPESPPDAPGSP